VVFVILFGGCRSGVTIVFLYILGDVQWKCVEGSDCGLKPSAVPTVGSVYCGKLPKISVKLFELIHAVSFEVKGIK